jgi:hypothetical protein
MSQAHIPPLFPQVLQQLALHLFPPTATVIPKKLLSTPLFQRHHFLDISPEDPADYLCWPSADSSSIIENLASIDREHLSFDKLVQEAVYSADSESTLVWVPIHSSNSHLQLLLLHDPEDPSIPWKYHDLQLFSLPQNSYTNLEAAIQAIHPQPLTAMDTLYPESAEAFWEGYASSGTSSPVVSDRQITAEPDSTEEKTERDYWSRYSDVQGQCLPKPRVFNALFLAITLPGTADSTIPSPRIPHPRSGRLEINWNGINGETVLTHDTPSHQEIAKALTGLSGLQLTVPEIEITAGPPEYVEENAEQDATEAALRAIFRMWKLQNPVGDRRDFLALVGRAIQ